ncbi:biopolymer transporter ExbD [Pyruvatibacter mobilis]|jgi:biopolymer transport protein ExbD|uniref:biopolymer transporter ExbD n=1 Tax=Pyruvatibacter mobilis TaxID=1712261 RepID=UPI003BA8F18A
MTTLRTRKPHHAPDGTLPLINIVLLLVLAFMIAGTVTAPLPEGFEPLISSEGTPEQTGGDPLILFVTHAGDVRAPGGIVSAAELPAILAGEAARTHGLTVKADARAPAARVFAILKTAKDKGVTDAVVVTMDRVE